MNAIQSSLLIFSSTFCFLANAANAAPPSTVPPPPGFTSLFNERDLAGWRIPEGDNGHWKAIDGVIDYDARSEAPRGKQDLWTEKDYGDFVLLIDWRIKETSGITLIPEVLPNGSYKLDRNGKRVIAMERPNADSGIYLRGLKKAQVNIWCWPMGSGEIHDYMLDEKLSPAVRKGAMPKLNADNPVGEWNKFEITLRGNRLTVVLNGKTVIDRTELPGIPARGPIGLQHHGGFRDGKYLPASSLVQFRNISIKELPAK